MTELTSRQRLEGCLIGGALGDSIGSVYEGVQNVDTFTVSDSLRVTDDTQLTLATCESIIELGNAEPNGIASAFLRWFRDRRITGIGASTLKSMRELDVGGHWAMVGARGERAAGNGAAMRIAPLAFVNLGDRFKARQTIRDVSRITHHNDEAYVGALAIVEVIRAVTQSNPLNRELVSQVTQDLPDSRVRDRLKAVLNQCRTLSDYGSRFGTSGYVVDSVPFAILAAICSDDFLNAIRAIIEFGGDTDTNCSMFGQMFGAAFGIEALPKDLILRIDEIDLIQRTVSHFIAANGAT